MLETLTKGFRNAKDRFRGVTKLTEENVAEALADVRVSLLEADVDLGIVREFLAKVTERCTGDEVNLRAGKRGQRMQVSAGDHFTKVCFDELVALMGEEEPIEPQTKGTRVLMMVGLQGTGKTTTSAKLARMLKKQGEKPLLVAADVRRPAAREQLKVLGEQIGVEVYTREGDDAPEICAEAVAHARENGFNTVILDTAGRLQIDDDLMTELEQIGEKTSPEFTTLVCDAMMGREAVNVARGFADRLKLDGLILTKLDGDSRGGAALAIRAATGIPIRCVTVGEGLDKLETFRPEGLATRILGMGDVVGLMQDFEEVVDVEKAEADAERMLKGSFTLEDFLSQLQTLQKMGPLKDLMEKMPFAGDMMPEGANVDGKELKRIEAMIYSMTPKERREPHILDDSRKNRIAKGSGTKLADLTEMLKRFTGMQQIMGQIGKAGPGILGKIPGLGKLMGGGGGMPGLPAGMDAGAMGGEFGGMPANRRAARAQAAQAKREKRNANKKHKKKSGGKKKRR